MTVNSIRIDDWKRSIVSSNRKYHEIEGKPLYHKFFDEVMAFHDPGLAPAKLNGKWFHINPNGSRAYKNNFDKVWGYYENLASVRLDGEAFHIDRKGNPAYESRFVWCGNYQGGACTVRNQDGYYYHIDHYGKPLYSARYSYSGDFREGFACVQTENGHYFHINFKGIPLYEKQFLDLGVFHKGAALAKDTRGWFHIDLNGDELYSQRFELAEPFYNGVSRVTTREGKVILIDEKGRNIRIIKDRKQNFLETISHDLVGYWKSFLLMAAINLDIFVNLPASLEKLASNANIRVDRMVLLLNALKEREYLNEIDGVWILAGRFGNKLEMSRTSLSNLSKHWLTQTLQAWDHLEDSLKTNTTGFYAAKGLEWFEWLKERPEDMEIYLETLNEYTKHEYSEVNSHIDFSLYRRIICAGIGSEFILNDIKEAKSLHYKILLYDSFMANKLNDIQRINPGIKVMATDLLADWNINADAVVLAKILHDWSDLSARSILSNAFNSLHKGGSLYIIEKILSGPGGSGSILSLHQNILSNGKERTLNEFRGLLDETGFSLDSVIRLLSGYSILICKK
jgi:hypothetical protein